MNKNDERILVFAKEIFDNTGLTEEMLSVPVRVPESVEDQRDMVGFLNDAWEVAGDVKRRGDVEEDMIYLQPIPYTVLSQGDKYFTYTRLEGGGESRLHGKSSIGVGGHQNEVEHYWNFEHIMAVNNSRELEEEVLIKNEYGEEIQFHYELAKQSVILGLIYSQETEVDSVHLGVLNIIELPEEWTVKAKEKDTLEGSFKTKEEIEELDLENWTKDAISVLS